MVARLGLVVVFVVMLAGCGSNATTTPNATSDAAKQSDDVTARSSLQSYLNGQESATLKFKDFDISKTNSITSPYEATVMCEKYQDGKTWKAVAHCVFQDGQWRLVSTKLLEP